MTALVSVSGGVRISGQVVVSPVSYFPVALTDAPPEISNNTTDSDHDIDISSKAVVSDDYNVMKPSGGLTKQLDAAWAEGTDAGGLDTGSIAADTWYSVWAIAKANGTQDALFSTSETSPTMPSGYPYKRRIGWILTDGSSNILEFEQHHNTFYLNQPVTDTTSNPSTSRVPLTLTAPPNTLALVGETITETGSDVPRIYLTPTWSTTEWPVFAVIKGNGSSTAWDSSINFFPVDDSSQVDYSRDSQTPSSITIQTVGWVDTRGMDE